MSSLIRRSNVVVGLANDREHSSLSAMASHFIIYIVSLVVHEDVDHLKIKLDWKNQQNQVCEECGPRSRILADLYQIELLDPDTDPSVKLNA